MFLELCKLSVNSNLKMMKITGWRVKAEDRQEWSGIVEQTKKKKKMIMMLKRKFESWFFKAF